MTTEESQSIGIDVSPEFIEENKKINLVRPSQFSPYTRSQRRRRRAEVARLHFEHGIPAIRIAEMLKVDRNTVNSDLKLLYMEASKQWGVTNLQEYLYKQLTRLEAQRDRLSSYLIRTNNDIDKSLPVERLIADIDFKLLSAMERLEYGGIAFWEKVIKEVNNLGKKEDISYTNLFELVRISTKSRRRLDRITGEVERK